MLSHFNGDYTVTIASSYMYVPYKSPTIKQSTSDTRVVFVSHVCDFRGLGGCLAIHECGYTRIHAHKVLHTRLPTRTRSIYMRVLIVLVSQSMHIL